MIHLVDVRKKLGDRWVTNGVSLTVPRGKTTCIVGRSGEGKSVLLKQIIGLMQPTSGSIVIDNVDITTAQACDVTRVTRRCGYVFQSAALLDSLTVFENIGLALLEMGVSPRAIRKTVEEKLALVHLEADILHKYPAALSGGMRKRVGLARTLMHDPDIILYDEPTTGLDPITARVVHELIREMQMRLGVTAIVVSHDTSIFEFVDFVALLHNGSIQCVHPAATVWQSDNAYLHQFVRGLSTGPMATDIPPSVSHGAHKNPHRMVQTQL